jgi:hypothetical protein
MVDLIDKSAEAELDVATKKKLKNRDRLSKRKVKSLADKGLKLAKDSEAILVQTPARDLPSSAVVNPTPISLDTDVEMTPAVALPVGDLKEGQIYHLVEGKLVVYDQAPLSTDQPSSSPRTEVLTSSIEQPISYAEINGKELVTRPASTGLEVKLAKLSITSSETSQSRGASGKQMGSESKLATGTPRAISGLVLGPPKATPAEKRKRKRLAAKAAKATKANKVAKASANITDAKVVVTIKGPPKPSTVGRQKTSKAGQGSSRKAKGPEG